MWTRISHIIIKYRLALLILLGLMTIFMGYHARQVRWSYDLAKVVPAHDPDMIRFEEFKSLFGEDGNIVAIAIQDSSIYEVENFRRFQYLSEELGTLDGVSEVISLPLMKRMVRDKEKRQFEFQDLFAEIPDDQQSLDSLLQLAVDQKFYDGQIINTETGALLAIVGINRDVVNTAGRMEVMNDILMLSDLFTEATGIELHIAGLPFVRSITTGKVKQEMLMFILFSVIITGTIMWVFFRSKIAVAFPMIIIAVVVVWVMGTLALLDFKITLLVGVIPSIIVVIGIPNSIYLLNKYHHEYMLHGNKMKAISRVTRKIGLVTLITNATTAVGFGVLAFTDILILKEFGIVSSLNIMATFLVSIILLPSVFSYLPPPSRKQLKHLKFVAIDKTLSGFDVLVHKYKYYVFAAFTLVVVASVIGLNRIQALSYMVDDIPEKSRLKKDLHFFEQNFSGIMPLEIVVDTQKKRGVRDLKVLKKIDEFENFLARQQDLSRPLSVVSFIKAIRQAYYNNNPKRYDLPDRHDRNFIFRYFGKGGTDQDELLSSFVDSTGQKIRISLQVADVGSQKMDSLVNQVIVPAKDSIFHDTNMVASITGTTPLFIKGNLFLIENLKFSFVLAFVIISIIMALLFYNGRMIVLSLIPNIIPLLVTAGIMGFAGIPLKPSTAIVFSIAFGISVDYSIHFLAKYRQELFSNGFFVPVSVSKALKEIGPSMIYTSIVLFAGFVIFTASDFGGTVALGFLTSLTLFVSMITNLTLLPALLMAFDDGKRRKDAHPPIENFDRTADVDTSENLGASVEKESVHM